VIAGEGRGGGLQTRRILAKSCQLKDVASYLTWRVSDYTDPAMNRMERSDWSIEISKNKLGILGCIYLNLRY